MDPTYTMAIVSGGAPKMPSNGKCSTALQPFWNKGELNGGAGLWLFHRDQVRGGARKCAHVHMWAHAHLRACACARMHMWAHSNPGLGEMGGGLIACMWRHPSSHHPS